MNRLALAWAVGLICGAGWLGGCPGDTSGADGGEISDAGERGDVGVATDAGHELDAFVAQDTGAQRDAQAVQDAPVGRDADTSPDGSAGYDASAGRDASAGLDTSAGTDAAGWDAGVPLDAGGQEMARPDATAFDVATPDAAAPDAAAPNDSGGPDATPDDVVAPADVGPVDGPRDDGGEGDATVPYLVPPECNGTLVRLEDGVEATGSIDADNDVDCFLILAPADRIVRVEMAPEEDLELSLLNAEGLRITYSALEDSSVERVYTRTSERSAYLIAVVYPFEVARGAYRILFTAEADEADSFDLATPIALGQHTGQIQTPTDEDIFALSAPAGILHLTLTPAEADLDLALYDADEYRLASSTNTDLEAESIVLAVNAATYFIVVVGFEGAMGGYTLDLSVTPD